MNQRGNAMRRKKPMKPDQHIPISTSIVPIHLLLVEDNPGDARLVHEMLRDQLYIKVEMADCLAAGMARLEQGGIDIVLLDLGLGDSQGLDTLISVAHTHPELPVVALTGLDDDALALRTVQAGGQDYLTKNTVTPDILRRTIRYAIERKRAERVLRISEERYRTLFETMDEGFCIVEMLYDPDGKAVDYRFVEINPAFDKHTGLPQALGKTIRQMVPNHDAHWFEIYGQVARTGEAIRFENPAIAMQRYYDVYAFRIGGDGSQRVGILFNDITIRKVSEAALQASIDELKIMSQQLLQAEKLATMGELASSIAHELNNPLATVSLRVESLIAQTTGDDPRLRELKIIGQEVERMGNLVSNLLQFSRRSQPQISMVNVCDEIEKTLELVHYHLRKHNVTVAREFKPEGPLIHADRQQLRQLFLNLFTNASDAMPEGGTLTIRVTRRPEEKQFCIEIADTGVGIPPEILPKIMEPFYTTKPEGKGTGLGLAICRRIAQAHNGTLSITSEEAPGNGTRVCITLPFSNGSNSASLRDE
jgi:signal transduction histidine kinase